MNWDKVAAPRILHRHAIHRTRSWMSYFIRLRPSPKVILHEEESFDDSSFLTRCIHSSSRISYVVRVT